MGGDLGRDIDVDVDGVYLDTAKGRMSGQVGGGQSWLRNWWVGRPRHPKWMFVLELNIGPRAAVC